MFKPINKKRQYYFNGVIEEEALLQFAQTLISRKFKKYKKVDSPDKIKSYLVHRLALLEHEVFCVLFLNNQHQWIAFEEMFQGTINGTSVYTREIIKRGLQLNAAAVILVHNHPSGLTEISRQDEALTKNIVNALDLVDIRVVDHCIVAGTQVISFVEQHYLP